KVLLNHFLIQNTKTKQTHYWLKYFYLQRITAMHLPHSKVYRHLLPILKWHINKLHIFAVSNFSTTTCMQKHYSILTNHYNTAFSIKIFAPTLFIGKPKHIT